jgi:hypothetical protein
MDVASIFQVGWQLVQAAWTVYGFMWLLQKQQYKHYLATCFDCADGEGAYIQALLFLNRH